MDALALPVKKTSKKQTQAAKAKKESSKEYTRAAVFIQQFYNLNPPESGQNGFEGVDTWTHANWDAKIERIIGACGKGQEGERNIRDSRVLRPSHCPVLRDIRRRAYWYDPRPRSPGTFQKKAAKANAKAAKSPRKNAAGAAATAADPWKMLHEHYAKTYAEKATSVIELVNSKFDELDKDNNGTLDKDELMALTKDGKTTKEMVDMFFNAADADGDNEIDKTEAAGLAVRPTPTRGDQGIMLEGSPMNHNPG